jgi:hypothetical protein
VRSELPTQHDSFVKKYGKRFETNAAALELLNDCKRRKMALKIFDDYVCTQAEQQVAAAFAERTASRRVSTGESLRDSAHAGRALGEA